MDRLPNEILVQIYKYISQDDIVNLPFHYISRALRSQDCRERFQFLLGSIDKKNLLRVDRALANSHIRPHVRRMSLLPLSNAYCQLEPPSLCWARHKHLIRYHGLKPNENGTTMPESLNGVNVHEYPELHGKKCPFCRRKSSEARTPLAISQFTKQRIFEQSGQAVRLLISIFTQLPPNLEALRIGVDVFRPADYSDWLPQDTDSGVSQDLLNRLPSHMSLEIIQAISASRLDSRIAFLSEDSVKASEDFHLYRSLEPGDVRLEVKFLDRSFRYLKNMEIKNCYNARNGDLRWYGGTATLCTNAVSTPVDFVYHDMWYTASSSFYLEDFSIKFCDDLSFSWLVAPFSDCYDRGVKFWRLKKIELFNITTQIRPLIYFLETMNSTLKEIRLNTIHLETGSWERIFRGLKGLYKLYVLELNHLSEIRRNPKRLHGDNTKKIEVYQKQVPKKQEVDLSGKNIQSLMNWICEKSVQVDVPVFYVNSSKPPIHQGHILYMGDS